MDLIFTRADMEDAGVLHNYEFDLAFGSDENNFECVVDKNDHCCEFGSFLYIEGTEYGGIIDGIEIKNSTKEVVYSGRTWHGILNSKVIEPDSGQAHLTVAGEANEIIASLLSRLGLTDLFEASTEDSGLTVKSYKMNRYINGYDGIRKMLKTVGGKLTFTFREGKVLLAASKAQDYSQEEELDSDVLCLDVKQVANTVNHLICLGSGNLEDRMVIHLYADENGNISQTQTFSGLDEHVAVFDYGNAEDEADLLKQGTDLLKELIQQDNLSVDVNDVDDPYDIGDIVGASDNITNIRIAVPITKKIVSIKNGVVTIDIKTDNANASAQPTSDYSGGSSGGGTVDPGLLDNYLKLSGGTMANGAVLNFPSSTGQSAKVNHVGNGLSITCYQDKTNENNRSAMKIEPEGDVLFFNKTVNGTTTWRQVIHDGNKSRIKPGDIGAFPSTGGTLTGDVTVNKTATPVIYLKSASGQSRLTKNANDSVDYGTQLIDYDKDGNRVTLVVRASYYNSPNLIARLVRLSADGTVNNTYEIIHTGNISQHVSAPTAMTVAQIRSICT